MAEFPEVHFFIDVPRADGAVFNPHPVDRPLTVAGWILPPVGHELRAVEVSVEDSVVASATLRLERPDVLSAFPDRSDSLRSGFSVTVPPQRLLSGSGGANEVTVQACWDGGREVLARIPLAASAGCDLERVSDFWAEQFETRRNNAAYWMNNPIIEREVYRLMTGAPYHWLNWLMKGYFAGSERFERALSICCGDGAHELELLKSGKVNHLTGFDISEGALQQARERIRTAGFGDDRFTLEVRDANRLTLDTRYDFILSVGAIHHVENLEGLMEEIARCLDRDGFFVLVEFVGPDRFQWTDDQVEIINGLLGTLDPKYLFNGRVTKFNRPSVEEMIRVDPSEAVRSSEILGLVRQHFSVTYDRAFNGTLLHMLYPLLNPDLGGGGHPDFDSIVRLLLYFEDVLTQRGVLSPDFVFLVCRPRRADA